MNRYVRHLSRIEFVVTYACTGCCKHCAEGGHGASGACVAPETAAGVVRDIAGRYAVASVMAFGGEPLLFPETVYAAHGAAAELGIPKRQLITNGFFSRDPAGIRDVAGKLARHGTNDVLLSVDAFHQETIPLEAVKAFAAEVKGAGVYLRVHPAWVVDKGHPNPYNRRTAEILAEFEEMGILQSEGNAIVPKGNAAKYLSGYYDKSGEYTDPYEEDPADIRTVSIGPDGRVLNGNLYETDILEILERYTPEI